MEFLTSTPMRSKFILNSVMVSDADTHWRFMSLRSGLFFRQDVAYQMRTKTKEECEGHYMKNFINNPLFSSTLLSLRQMEEHLSRTADTAIPFKRKKAPANVQTCLIKQPTWCLMINIYKHDFIFFKIIFNKHLKSLWFVFGQIVWQHLD